MLLICSVKYDARLPVVTTKMANIPTVLVRCVHCNRFMIATFHQSVFLTPTNVIHIHQLACSRHFDAHQSAVITLQ